MPRLLAWTIVPIALLTASVLHAQTTTERTDRVVPTIPQSQIAPAPLSSPYEFLSVATSADDFVLRAAALAETHSTDADIQALAEHLSTTHSALITASQQAGKADGVDIAQPGVDGEQSRLIGRLTSLEGAEFDQLYVEANIYVYQRTIAYYLGYADEPDDLGAFAKQSLPLLGANYEALIKAAEAEGIDDPQQAAEQE